MGVYGLDMARCASDDVAKPAPMMIAATKPSTSQGNRLFAKKARKGLFFNTFVALYDRDGSPGGGFTAHAPTPLAGFFPFGWRWVQKGRLRI